MRLTCPSCHAEVSLDALLESEAARRAVARLVELTLPFGALVLRYVALFRPGKRRLSIDRMVTLIDELLPDMQRNAVARKGRDWNAPPEVWRAAFEAVLAARDKGTLTSPLTSHGYLYEVIVGMADKAESAAERERETERDQSGRARAAGAAARPVPAAAVVFTAPPAPPAYTAGPSRAALAIKAQMEATRAARMAGAEPQGDQSGAAHDAEE